MDHFYFWIWWFTILAIGFVFFPVTSFIFRGFYDKGYLFSKTLGLAIGSYIIWFLASTHIAPFSRRTCILVFLMCLGLIVFASIKYKIFSFNDLTKNNLLVMFFEEFIFTALLLYWTFLRGLLPQIEGLEKFMDMGFVNAIFSSSYFPPNDMWLAGEPINYYYFGHYVTAYIAKLSGVVTPVAYNLMMATLFAFSFALVMSLVLNMLKLSFKNKKSNFLAIGGALVGGAVIAFGGNLHYFFFGILFPILKQRGVTFPANLKITDNYWFPDATRYIGHNPPAGDLTIHEFPNYSFIVSDLHAHVVNIMFVLTGLAIFFAYFLKQQELSEKGDNKISHIPHPMFFLIPFFIGIFKITNTWDFPIYTTVAMFVFICAAYIRCKNIQQSILYGLLYTVYNFVCIHIVSFLFDKNFIKITNGIKITPTHTAPGQFLIVWGYQLFFVVTFLFVLYRLAMASVKLSKAKKTPAAVNTDNPISISDIFCAILCISAFGLLLIPEIIYVKDIYSPPYHRANTLFKLTYQSYIMFCIAIGFICVRIYEFKLHIASKIIFCALSIFLVFCALSYSVVAIDSWYNPTGNTYKQLDGGMNYLAKKYPDDFKDDAKAVNWLIQNEKSVPTIVEATGESYSLNCRISAFTGFPTIIGWRAHEWLWHNSANLPGDRIKEVDKFYTTTESKNDTASFIAKYKVKYIVIGNLERKKYGTNLKENELSALGENLNFGTTKLIKIFK